MKFFRIFSVLFILSSLSYSQTNQSAWSGDKDVRADRKAVKVDHFSLEQNYPNPFNPSTRITYSIPEGKYVKLTVYNIFGNEVTTLVKGYKEAGQYTVQFNASSLPGGVYVYSLQAGQFRDTKRMVLLK